jgi:polysaccharide deacetylase 2 family uncharacterized protein YibQ
MLRGIFSGLVIGAMVSAFALGVMSVLSPLPESHAQVEPDALAADPAAPSPDPASSGRPMAPPLAILPPLPEAMPDFAPEQELAPQAVSVPPNPAEALAQAPQPAPEAQGDSVATEESLGAVMPPPAVLLGAGQAPGGSEFTRAAEDRAPLPPRSEPEPPQRPVLAAPTAAAPSTPYAAGTEPAERPERVATLPEGFEPPPALRGEEARLPMAESPLPVPPAGEIEPPRLGPTSLPAEPEIALEALQADTGVSIILPLPEPEPPAAPTPPQPGFSSAPPRGFSNAPGVLVNRLPTLGADTPSAEPQVAVQVEPQTPLERYAQPYEASGKPMLAVLMLDPGGADGWFGRAALAQIDFPVTVVLNPMLPGAAQAAAQYYAEGFEVAILATALPEGATLADLEVIFAAWRAVIPQAVALVEPPEPVLQSDRLLSQQLVAILKREGLALVTQGKGLNAAGQLATSAALSHAEVWRVLDAEGDKAPAILRYLERARFEAARGQGVAVMLHAWPETMNALAQFRVDSSASIDLAPISALVQAAR